MTHVSETAAKQSTQTRGTVFIHSSPRALCTHIEWALGGLLGVPVNLDWVEQPVTVGALRAELSWIGQPGLGSRIVSELRSYPHVRLEVTEEPSTGCDGQRYVSTPTLGVWHSPMGANGDSFVSEEFLRTSVAQAVVEGASVVDVVDQVLGGPWDRELEPFRYAGEGTPVRWLHQVG